MSGYVSQQRVDVFMFKVIMVLSGLLYTVVCWIIHK